VGIFVNNGLILAMMRRAFSRTFQQMCVTHHYQY